MILVSLDNKTKYGSKIMSNKKGQLNLTLKEKAKCDAIRDMLDDGFINLPELSIETLLKIIKK